VNTITLKGIHGTTTYHANNILVNGFDISCGKVGKAGKGIYFWHYINNKNIAMHCAEVWCDFSLQKGYYDKNKDCRIVKINVHIDSEKDKILDFNDEIRESFLEAFPLGEYNESTYGAKIDMFIQELEDTLMCRFHLLKVSLSVPNVGRNAPLSNSFPAIIVKDEVEIKILECI